MPQVTGVVKRIMSRGKAYNLQMDSGDYFGFGFDAPNFGEGAEIGFDVQYNGNFANVVKGSVEVYNAGSPQQQQQGGYQQGRQGGGGYQGGGRSGGGNRGGGQGGGYKNKASGGKDNYWEEKAKRDVVVQRQIQHQASRNAAIALVTGALTNGAVSLPTKKGDQLDAIIALVDEITERYDFAVDAVGIAAGSPRQGNAPEPRNVQDDMNGGYQE